MSKKVLIVAGSPRKQGNSDMLCDSFRKGAEESGHNVDKIYVHDQKIGPCKACYGCIETGICVQKDDMADILEQIMGADVIVLATPVYFYSVNGQLKTLIDRTFARYKQITGKDFYFIATAAAPQSTMERAIDSLRGFTDCLPDSSVKAVIYGAGVFQKGDIKDSAPMKEAYEAGKNA